MKNVSKEALWKLLKVCIAFAYILLGMLLGIRFIQYANYWAGSYLRFGKIVCFALMAMEVIPILMIHKGARYLKRHVIDHFDFWY